MDSSNIRVDDELKEQSEIESALKDIDAGRVETFNSVEELFEELESED